MCPPLFTELAELIGEVGRRPGGVATFTALGENIQRQWQDFTALRRFGNPLGTSCHSPYLLRKQRETLSAATYYFIL